MSWLLKDLFSTEMVIKVLGLLKIIQDGPRAELYNWSEIGRAPINGQNKWVAGVKKPYL